MQERLSSGHGSRHSREGAVLEMERALVKHRCIAAIAALFTRYGWFHRPQTPKSRANGDDHRKLLAGLGLKPRPDITDAGDCPDCQRTADSAVDWLQDRTEFYYGPDGPPRRDG